MYELSSFAQAAVTKCHRQSDFNNGNFFLRVLEVGKAKIKVSADSVSGESSLWAHRWPPSQCVLIWQK